MESKRLKRLRKKMIREDDNEREKFSNFYEMNPPIFTNDYKDLFYDELKLMKACETELRQSKDLKSDVLSVRWQEIPNIFSEKSDECLRRLEMTRYYELIKMIPQTVQSPIQKNRTLSSNTV